MKSDLQLLIECLQKEYEYLEQEMNNCVEHLDFKGAEAFRKPLLYTKRQLTIHKNIDNPNLRRIESLRRQLAYFRKEPENELDRLRLLRMTEILGDLEGELEKLERVPSPFYLDGEELVTCLEMLISKQIDKFELEVGEMIFYFGRNGDAYVQLEITRIDGQLLVKWFGPDKISLLKKMGFVIAARRAKGDFVIIGTSSVVDLVARLVYDVFEYYGKDGEIRYLSSV